MPMRKIGLGDGGAVSAARAMGTGGGVVVDNGWGFKRVTLLFESDVAKPKTVRRFEQATGKQVSRKQMEAFSAPSMACTTFLRMANNPDFCFRL